MRNDYFEPDLSLHPVVVLSPTHDGAAFSLLGQGTQLELAHQITAHREAFRALLRKRAIAPAPAVPTRAAALTLVQFRIGVHVVLVPVREPDVEPFTRQVQIIGVAETFAAAADLAAEAGCAALICELIGLADGLGPVDALAWSTTPR